MNRWLTLFCGFIAVLSAMASDGGDKSLCPVVKVAIERLPDLNVPRSGHNVVCVNGQIVVIGGHTKGYIPTPTAEYFENGAWHEMHMTYEHDCGVSIPMSSGKVMIAGGLEKNLGIGQTYAVEIYDPNTHTFEGMGCLYKKRALVSAIKISGGRIIFAGNWHNTDCIERYDGHGKFDSIAPVSFARALPYVLRTSDDDAIVLGVLDSVGNVVNYGAFDALDGTAMKVPLLDEWTLLYQPNRNSDNLSFIGDTARSEYAYLLPAQDRQGQLAFIQVRGKEFSLLPTVCPMPMRSPWEEIIWSSRVMADRTARRAYIKGYGASNRLYVLAVDYLQQPATMTLYYTEPLSHAWGDEAMILTPEGDLLLTGGIIDSNFVPLALAMLIKVGPGDKQADLSHWLWVCIALGVLAALALMVNIYWRRIKKRKIEDSMGADGSIDEAGGNEVLAQRLHELMKREQLFLQPDLRLADVARALQVSDRNLSKYIKDQLGCSFLQLVSQYRVEYVQQMLTEHPDKKMITVAQEAGFANEVSFFRTFKAITGMTPKEWQNSRITDKK